MIVHVVEFAPAVGFANAVGGFDWFEGYQDAVEHLQARIKENNAIGDRYDIALWSIEVADRWRKNDITNYIDGRLRL